MKTFNTFILEDFNSNGAKQFEMSFMGARYLKDYTAGSTMVFFESLPKRPFNLARYMKSFDSENARNSMKSGKDLRGTVFSTPQNYLVFVWFKPQLHSHFFKLLEDNKGKYPYPDFKYVRSYNDMNLVSFGDTVPETWCFPFIWFSDDIFSNLSDSTLYELNKQYNLVDTFMFTSKLNVMGVIDSVTLPKKKQIYRN